MESIPAGLRDIAGALYAGGVREMFGVAGDPITPLIAAAEGVGMRYYGCRNEQAASYAASAVSFLTARSRIGVVMTVGGPGFVHGLAGVANATVNGWPMLLVSPASESVEGFQYIDQATVAKGLCKSFVEYVGPHSVDSVIKLALTPPCGGVCLSIPIKAIHVSIPRQHAAVTVRCVVKASGSAQLISHLSGSLKPLVIIGSGASLISGIEGPLKAWIEKWNIPFVSESLARGILDDSHQNCVSAARGEAIKTCDVAVLICTKLDWMLSRGQPPKWKKETKIFIVDEYVHTYPSAIERSQMVVAPNVPHLISELVTAPVPRGLDRQWIASLQKSVLRNRNSLHTRFSPAGRNSDLLTHWEAIGVIKEVLLQRCPDCAIVSEGSNTMDVARVALDIAREPRTRLDAGRWGTMGSGLGFVLACGAVNPERTVVAIEGDSAMGFSGMELETIIRYKIKTLIIVFNNGGIYTGEADNATAFTKGIDHSALMISLGGSGFAYRRGGRKGLKEILAEALKHVQELKGPALLDIAIDPTSGVISGSLSRL